MQRQKLKKKKKNQVIYELMNLLGDKFNLNVFFIMKGKNGGWKGT